MVNSVKVFRKTSPNGKLSVYLSRRDFLDRRTHTEPVDGVVVVDNDYLKDRKVFARVVLTYRYGREEDEVMGLKFSKEFEVVNAEVTPPEKLTATQEKVVQKLGGNTHPFSVSLTEPAPCTVALDPGIECSSNMLGVSYVLNIYVSKEKEEDPNRRDTVSFTVRKIQYAPINPNSRQPQLMVRRTYTFTPGMLILEVTLGRDIYFHGQEVEAYLRVINKSKKTVKHICGEIVQHVDITMTNTSYTRVVASLESQEGCPVIPGTSFSRPVGLWPALANTSHFGVALDGQARDRDVTLGSSTLCGVNNSASDCLGIIVSYSFRVTLHCGAIGGDVSCDLPFKLMHPDPDDLHDDDTIEFEDFTLLRRGKSIDELDEE